MTRRQMVMVIAINAGVSTLITLLLVLVVLPKLDGGLSRPPATATPGLAQAATMTPVEAVATPAPVMHTVQSGDTISALAEKYDVPAEDIIAANQLQNPNLLQVGTDLLIPIGGLPQATPTLTPVPTATDTPIPFEPPSADMTATAAAEAGATVTPLPTDVPLAGELRVEIGDIIGAGQVEQEQVVIGNMGERLADMQGWTLSDTAGNVYTFANFRLWKGGSVIVHTRIGQDGNPPANFYWGKLEPIWTVGQVATLKDANGQIVSTYTVGQ